MPAFSNGIMLQAIASSKATPSTKSTLWWKYIRPGAFEPIHDHLERFEGNALLAILQAKEARWRDS
jgi:hypothetical protein